MAVNEDDQIRSSRKIGKILENKRTLPKACNLFICWYFLSSLTLLNGRVFITVRRTMEQ